MYCSVILRGAIRQTDNLYTYRVPEELRTDTYAGSLVSVPFGKGDSKKTAVVVEVINEFNGDARYIKDIDSLLSKTPVLNPDQRELIEKISERFNCTRGDVV